MKFNTTLMITLLFITTSFQDNSVEEMKAEDDYFLAKLVKEDRRGRMKKFLNGTTNLLTSMRRKIVLTNLEKIGHHNIN